LKFACSNMAFKNHCRQLGQDRQLLPPPMLWILVRSTWCDMENGQCERVFIHWGYIYFQLFAFRSSWMMDGLNINFIIQEKTAQCLLDLYLEWDCVELFCFFSIVMNNLWARGLF
jgi:hypothetical protein